MCHLHSALLLLLGQGVTLQGPNIGCDDVFTSVGVPWPLYPQTFTTCCSCRCAL